MPSTGTGASSSSAGALRVTLGAGGLIAVALGLFVLFAPGSSATSAADLIAFLIAAYAIVVGIVYLATSIFSGAMRGWTRTGHILLGIVYLIAGGVMLSNLLATGALLILLITITIGVAWLFEGFTALTAMRASRYKAMTVIYAIISIIAGVTLMFSPMMDAITLWILLGISLVVLGVAQVVRAFSIKTSA